VRPGRSAFYARTALPAAAIAVVYGPALTVLQLIEPTTGDWGLNLRFFRVPYLVAGPVMLSSLSGRWPRSLNNRVPCSGLVSLPGPHPSHRRGPAAPVRADQATIANVSGSISARAGEPLLKLCRYPLAEATAVEAEPRAGIRCNPEWRSRLTCAAILVPQYFRSLVPQYLRS
jgi:hypothetical protein